MSCSADIDSSGTSLRGKTRRHTLSFKIAIGIPSLWSIFQLILGSMVFRSHVFPPMIFPTPPERPVTQVFRLQGVLAKVERTGVLDSGVVHAVIVTCEIFPSEEAFVALMALRWANVMLLVAAGK
jgi:hypothetical protein